MYTQIELNKTHNNINYGYIYTDMWSKEVNKSDLGYRIVNVKAKWKTNPISMIMQDGCNEILKLCA